MRARKEGGIKGRGRIYFATFAATPRKSVQAYDETQTTALHSIEMPSQEKGPTALSLPIPNQASLYAGDRGGGEV